ncbi:MAG: hypothetical protein HFJ12_00935 [Bacilli bacterium]|nr:hypothetical protein [Bacilli bacterium]
MKNLFIKIKTYHPPKYICILYFFVPIFICTTLNLAKENDIWFLLNHGEYVFKYGFPTTEPFSMHQGFSFVMQQWLTSAIFYFVYHYFGRLGLLIVIEVVNILILYFLYKLCMLLSNDKYYISIVMSCIVDLLLLTSFILPRPQIFTYLFLIITLYIMELFYQNKNTRAIYVLPFLSLLQINFHASMWFLIFLFILPFLVCLVMEKIKNKKDNRIFQLLGILTVMSLVGFLNPYGWKNIAYIFHSYGIDSINNIVIEMAPPVISGGFQTTIGIMTFLVLGVVMSIYIFYKQGQIRLRYMFLLAGVTILSLMNIRSFALLVIGSLPFLSFYLKDLEKKPKQKDMEIPKNIKGNYIGVLLFLVTYVIVLGIHSSGKGLTNYLEEGIDFLLKNNNRKDIVLYTDYNNGSYAEYRGLKPYIDTRAEVFLKSNNHKKDIMEEYYLLFFGVLDYNQFIEKYHFTHLIVTKNDRLYQKISKDKRYRVIYKEKEYKIFEKVKN